MKSSAAAIPSDAVTGPPIADAEPGPRTPSILEYVSVILFLLLALALATKLIVQATALSAVPLLLAAVAGYVASDFASGFVHWLFDTWGDPDTPVVGQTFIVPFRVHHTDPIDITRHGFVATNGHNCLASLPVLVVALLLPSGAAWVPPLAGFLLCLTLGVFATNQFHKWAHEKYPGAVIGWLQDRGVILGREHHDIHHSEPYDRHYCITTGWLNPVLDRVGFFRSAERVITAITGAQPRRDDLAGTQQASEG